MKILIAVPWDEQPGGVVTVVNNLARYLRSQNHEVFFFHPLKTLFLKRRTTSLGFPGIQMRLTMPFGSPYALLRLLTFPFVFPLIMIQLIWFIRSRGIEVVNVHYPMDSLSYFAMCRRLLPIRLVTSLHGSDTFPNGRAPQRYSRAFRFMLRSSDLIVLPSDAYRKRVVNLFPEIADKTIFIHNGIPAEKFESPAPLKASAEIGRYILSVAALVEWKGIDVLLRAAKPLLESDRSLNLVIVGEGPARGNLTALASSLGIENQTHFPGSKSSSEVAGLLLGCEVFVLASKAESFGIVILEALACRKLVVASNVGGVPEIIEHEKNGILVEAGNVAAFTEALRRVLDNDELKRTLARNGYNTALKNFSFSRTGAAYEAAFTALLNTQTAIPADAAARVVRP